MITIKKSKTTDTRSCDYSKVSMEQLEESSKQHIHDVNEAMRFFRQMIIHSAIGHDEDKISDIKTFHADFITGFKQTTWWDKHRTINRHHLLSHDGVPEDVNLIDVLEMIADCVMAGMARTGTVYPLQIATDLLKRAFDNTAKLLKDNVRVDGFKEGEVF